MTAEPNKQDQEAPELRLYSVWWHRLTGSELCKEKRWQALPAAHRAILRRCSTLDEVLLTEAFQELWLSFSAEKRTPAKMEVVALVAWVLASVQKSGEKQLAVLMASSPQDSDNPKVSPLRFQQLIKSRTAEEFGRRLRRVLAMVAKDSSGVSVSRLAAEIERWYWQHLGGRYPTSPADKQTLKWAMSYYQTIPQKQQS